MRVSNEGTQPGGGIGELLRLQAEFQTVLAAETMRYLGRLQHTTTAAPGGTVVRPAPDASIEASGDPGATVTLPVEVENRQQVHLTVTPSVSVLAAASGTMWFPQATADPPSALVSPGEVAAFTVSLPLPEELPPDRYRGVLVLHGFRDDGIPVTIDVAAPVTGSEGEGASGHDDGDDGDNTGDDGNGDGGTSM